MAPDRLTALWPGFRWFLASLRCELFSLVFDIQASLSNSSSSPSPPVTGGVAMASGGDLYLTLRASFFFIIGFIYIYIYIYILCRLCCRAV